MPIHFEDRQAKYPNRWTMKKSDGTSEVITLVRNDEPIYDGTPINAETLNSLSDVAGADLARAQAEAARTKAQNAAASAAISETNVKASESAAQKSAEEAAASAALSGTRAGTDKTLSVEDAPADAKKVGDELAVRYTKEEVQKLIEDSLAAYREEEYAKIKFWVSNDPTSPAEMFGGTWEQIAADQALMGASTTHPAGSTAEAGLPNVTGILNNFAGGSVSMRGALKIGSISRITQGYRAADSVNWSWEYADNCTFDASRSSSLYGKSSTVQPPAYYTYVWHRVE